VAADFNITPLTSCGQELGTCGRALRCMMFHVCTSIVLSGACVCRARHPSPDDPHGSEIT